MGLDLLISFLLKNWKLVIFALCIVTMVAMGSWIKFQSNRIVSLKVEIGTLEEKIEVKNKEIVILKSEIDKQNAAILAWKAEADVQKEKIKLAEHRMSILRRDYEKEINRIHSEAIKYTEFKDCSGKVRKDGSLWMNEEWEKLLPSQP